MLTIELEIRSPVKILALVNSMTLCSRSFTTTERQIKYCTLHNATFEFLFKFLSHSAFSKIEKWKYFDIIIETISRWVTTKIEQLFWPCYKQKWQQNGFEIYSIRRKNYIYENVTEANVLNNITYTSFLCLPLIRYSKRVPWGGVGGPMILCPSGK